MIILLVADQKLPVEECYRDRLLTSRLIKDLLASVYDQYSEEIIIPLPASY